MARANEGEKLLVWGYNAFEAIKLFDANTVIATPRVWKGASNEVKLGLTSGKPLVVAIPAGTNPTQVTSQVARPDPLVAPLAVGQNVGAFKVLINNQLWQSIPLQAIQDVASSGWLGRTWDGARMMFR
jgi:D-alanyl-D-alanine carboxypeptidase (penicillin-binding protein 5/6)